MASINVLDGHWRPISACSPENIDAKIGLVKDIVKRFGIQNAVVSVVPVSVILGILLIPHSDSDSRLAV